MTDPGDRKPRGPVDPLVVPRFAGPSTFARLPRLDEVDRCDVAVVGVPFDARSHVQARSPLRTTSRFARLHACCGAITPRSTCSRSRPSRSRTRATWPARRSRSRRRSSRSKPERTRCSTERITSSRWVVTTRSRCHSCGLHTRHGPVALVHFDAHLDTWDTYFGAAYTHGTPFRRALEEGLLLGDRATHIGIRGPLFSPQDLKDDAGFGFEIVTAMDLETSSIKDVVERVRRASMTRRCTSRSTSTSSIRHGTGDGDPGAGRPEQPRAARRAPRPQGPRLEAADLVEVAPAYDHAEITSMAASHVAYELISLLASREDRCLVAAGTRATHRGGQRFHPSTYAAS